MNLIIRLLSAFVFLFGLLTGVAHASAVGELRGIATVSQGKSSYQIALELPAGINDMVPELAVRYQQGSGNGALGVGVHLSGFSTISRCSKNKKDDAVQGGISFDNSDVYCLDGQRLFLTSGRLGQNGSEYRLEHSPQTKIVANGTAESGPLSWNVYTSDGYISHYGSRDDAKLSVNQHGLEWLLSSQTDRFNNAITYRYQIDQGKHYISQISYADVTLQFNYSARPDRLKAYRFGAVQVLARKLDSISIKRAGALLRQLSFSYQNIELSRTQFTRLQSVKVCDANNQCMPEHVFEWQSNPYKNTEPTDTNLFQLDEFKGFISGDINRDGANDICYLDDTGLYCSINQGAGQYDSAKKWSHANDFQGDDWQEIQNYSSLALIDMNDDSYPDVCAFNQKGYYCALNRQGQGFQSGRYWSRDYHIDQAVRLLDFNQDGLVDVCRIEAEQVICARNTGNGLSSNSQLTDFGFPLEKQYNSLTLSAKNKLAKEAKQDRDDYDPSINMPQSQFIDINRDGYIDLCGVKLNGGFYCAYGQASVGNINFGPLVPLVSGLPIGDNPSAITSKKEYKKDKKVLEQLQRTLRLTDVTGDGLAELCYRKANQYLCHENSGIRFLQGQNWFTMSDSLWENTDSVAAVETSMIFADRNGDQLADLCFIAGEQLYCAYGNGRRFTDKQQVAVIHADLELLEKRSGYYSNFVRSWFGLKTKVHSMAVNSVYGPFKRAIDLDGDSITDDCYRSINGLNCLSYQNEPLALLKSVTSGLGVKSEFVYGLTGNRQLFSSQASNDDELVSIKPNIKVVKALKQDNGIGGVNTTSYFYRGYMGHKEYGLLGFNQIETTDTASKLKVVTSMGYHSNYVAYVKSIDTYADNKKVSKTKMRYQEV